LNTTANVLSDAQRTAIQGGSNECQSTAALIPGTNGTFAGAPAFFGSATAPVNIDQTTLDIIIISVPLISCTPSMPINTICVTNPLPAPRSLDSGHARGHRQVFTLGETHVFNPSVINEARAGLNRIHITFIPNNLTDPNTVALGSCWARMRPSCRASDYEPWSHLRI